MYGINKMTSVVTISGDEDYMLGQDQVYNGFPCVFPTVTLRLCGANSLWGMVQQLRHERGEKGEADFNAYYGLNGYTADKVDSSIDVFIDDPEADDNGVHYVINLLDEDLPLVRQTVDYQCRGIWGKGVDDLLEAAEYNMEGRASKA